MAVGAFANAGYANLIFHSPTLENSTFYTMERKKQALHILLCPQH